jgi:hypothetical protein
MITNNSPFDFSVDESIVRTYRCIHIQQLFRPKTTGTLTVTTQRVVYHAISHSVVGKSATVCEMPLEDVAGVNVLIGRRINWVLYLLFSFILYISSVVIQASIEWFFQPIIIVLLSLPVLLMYLYQSRFIADDAKKEVTEWVNQRGRALNLQISLDNINTWAYRSFLGAIAVFIWWTAHIPEIQYSTPWSTPSVLIFGYFLLYMRVFGFQQMFVLTVASKTSQGSGITIDGAKSNIPWLNITPVRDVFQGRPAEDAQAVLHEIGALLTDIRLLGSFGVQKWLDKPYFEGNEHDNII